MPPQPNGADGDTGNAPMRDDPEARWPENVAVSKHDRGWRMIVRNFTPSWFCVNMGTGIVSILLFGLPYNGIWLYWISVGIFGLNTFLFCVFLAITTLRYTLYPEIWGLMIHHPFQSMFIGTFPMGFATIISMMVLVCSPAWGSWVSVVAWAFWVADSVISAACAVSLPFLLMAPHDPTELRSMTAAWLLPAISTIVAAATGSVVAGGLPNPQMAIWTITASYILWAMGEALALMVLVMYFQRLALYQSPPRSVIVTVVLPLGPMGQGGFAILNLGVQAKRYFRRYEVLDPGSGDVLYTMGFILTIFLWAFGLVWLFVAIVSLVKTRRFPFTIGWWGTVFPTGVYANCTVLIAKQMPSKFFKNLGTIFSVAVVVLWIIVSLATLKGVVTRSIFYAPCLSEMHVKNKEKQPSSKWH